MARTIPEGATLVKEGLYCYAYDVTLGSLSYTVWELFSAEGWCFYDAADPVNYDEEGNLLPADQRIYAQYMKTRAGYNLDDLICVPVDPSYEIVSAPTGAPETM